MSTLKTIVRYLTKRTPEKILPIDIKIMYFFRDNGMKYMSKYWKNKIYYKYNVDIGVGSQIEEGTRFTHPIGIVIGDDAIVRKGAIILQNVTIGGSFNSGSPQVIGSGAILCAGSKVLGKVEVGANCIIGANAVITKNVSDDMVVSGYNKVIGRVQDYA
ncbi:hypothetical protein MID13_00900 [Vibrio gigantis]|uniref:hypothetical protein n=1 Tax=Vibrio gigantis TaxID=296199 RepID=UPI001EFB4FB4|nr:hypothetical protein [Vibrio gigantis]ULN64433.1 hypothetical protein MID13_00900 [Vibrio gigantis]